MTIKKRMIKAFETHNGGFKSMLSNQERELISKWHSERKLSIWCIERRLDVSRNTVRRWLHGVQKKNNPRNVCGLFLKRQSGEIEKLYAEREFRCPPLRQRINQTDAIHG